MKGYKDNSPSSPQRSNRMSMPFESSESIKNNHDSDNIFGSRESFLAPSFGGESPEKNESRSFK